MTTILKHLPVGQRIVLLGGLDTGAALLWDA